MTAYFELKSIFKDGQGRFQFSKFREFFFPHMTLAGEDPILERGIDEPKNLQQK